VRAPALQHPAEVEEIRIGLRRPDGSTRSVPIWVVLVGDHIHDLVILPRDQEI